MHDRETGSLWAQVLGEGISGEMEGTVLTEYPAQHMSYAEFKSRFPTGRLLNKPQGIQDSPYNSYFASRDRLGIFGRENKYSQLDGKDLVLGLRFEGREVAVSVDYLKEHGFALIDTFDVRVVVSYDSSGAGFSAFIIPAEAIDDVSVETGRQRITVGSSDAGWDMYSGQSLNGEQSALSSYPVMTAYWFAWISFFPETQLIKLDTDD